MDQDGGTLTPPQTTQNMVGPKSTMTTCQFCGCTIKTTVRFTSTSRTHVAAAMCGMLCGCCCIPFCCKSAKNTDHYCPSCHRYIGTYVK